MISIFYLTVMAFYILRPALPYIEYAVNHEYIATQLCIYKNIPNNMCQGQCHLQKALEKNAENEKPDQNKNNTRNTKADDFIIARYELPPLQAEYKSLFNDTIVESIINFTKHVFVPPKL